MNAKSEIQPPAPAAMMNLITGYWISQTIGAVALLGVADHFDGGARSADDLAPEVGADPQALYRALRLLASVGVFAEAGPRSFVLTPLGDTLRSDAPASVRYFAITETAPGHWQPWGRLADSLRTGKPMSHEALGMTLWEWYSKNPEEAGYFSAAMGNLSALAAEEMVRVYDFSTASVVADIGGAHGVLLVAALRANPKARGILFDLPHVVATARDSLTAAGVADRATLEGGDFLKAVPAGADLHILKHIIHDWDDEKAATILRNCHASLTPGGKLLLLEIVIPEDNKPSLAKSLDLNMLVMLGGRERTKEEYGSLLGSAGFRTDRVIPTHGPFGVIEATRI